MNATDVIREVQENASEWLEMVDNPAELMAGILAQQVVNLKGYIVYLERRLKAHDSNSSSRRSPAGNS